MKRIRGIGLMLVSLFMMSCFADSADFVLEIYGNANMDDLLNDDDLQYLEGILSGTNDATRFADANFDGKIDEKDAEQLQKILDGTEEKLTFMDIFEENVTVNKPIKRLVNMGYSGVEMTRILNAEDVLVAYGQDRTKQKTFLPELERLPFVGNNPDNCDFEKIISLKPDAVQTNLERKSALIGGRDQKRIFEKDLEGIPLICLNMREQDTLVKNVRTYGYILDRESEAEEFIEWYSKYYNIFKSRTASIPEEERPTCVFEYTPYYCYASGSNLGQIITMAGGKNILDDAVGPNDPKYGAMLEVQPEFVTKENPRYIFVGVESYGDGGYETNDMSKMAATKEQVMNRTELANIDAVKFNDVYCLDYLLLLGAGNNIIGTAYLAKLFHPDLFQDIDPEAIHQEYVDKFCRIDFNIRNQGAFVYPDYENWGR
jgi:iron complex transport system substrate-binding protein